MKSLLTEYKLHSMNDAPCGKRLGYTMTKNFRMYALIEILVDSVRKVLMVFPNWSDFSQHIGHNYLRKESVQSHQLEDGVDFALPCLRNMYLVKLMNQADISNYMQDASSEGIDRVYQVKRELKLRSASFGLIVSNGFTDQDGGNEGTDYCMFRAIRDAMKSDWIKQLGKKPNPTINEVITAMKNDLQGLFVNSPYGSAHGRMMSGRDIVIFPGSSVTKPGCFIALSLLMYSRFSGEQEKEVYQITLDDIIMNESTGKWEIKIDEIIVNNDDESV